MSRVSGFTLKWFIKDDNGTKITEELPARQEDWKQEVPTPAYKESSLHDMVQLARELRMQNMTKEEIVKKVIQQKSQMRVIPEVDHMCLMGQVKKEKQEGVFSKLFSNISINEKSGEPSDEDIETGYELFHALVFCPSVVFSTYTFLDQLLSNETPRTIIYTIVYLLQSDAIKDETSFALTKQFYHILASTLDLQYGNILLAKSSNEQREAVLRKGLPFFLNHTDLVENCLQESTCDGVQHIFQKIGIFCFSIYSFICF